MRQWGSGGDESAVQGSGLMKTTRDSSTKSHDNFFFLRYVRRLKCSCAVADATHEHALDGTTPQPPSGAQRGNHRPLGTKPNMGAEEWSATSAQTYSARNLSQVPTARQKKHEARGQGCRPHSNYKNRWMRNTKGSGEVHACSSSGDEAPPSCAAHSPHNEIVVQNRKAC